MVRTCLSILFLFFFLTACQEASPPDASEKEPTSPPPTEVNARWSDPATWPGGVLPAAGDDVTIPAGKQVLLDVNPPALGGLIVEGALVFAAQDIALSADWIMVKGIFEVGTANAPYTHRAVITLTGADEDVMGMGARVFGVIGGRVSLHGETRLSWTRLNATAQAGQNELILETAPDWRAGDQIIIASTDFDFEQAEAHDVVSVDGKRVTLARPLDYMHWGETVSFKGKTVDERAEVGLLSRNILLQGDAGSDEVGLGGHLMVMDAKLFASGVEFYRMGQLGRMGRYPVHFHMAGDAARGSYLRGSSIHHSFSRCVTIHGSHGVEVKDVVAFETFGHCFFLEDGIETDNVFAGNLGLSVRKPPEAQALLPSDLDFRGPSVYWISHPNNSFTANVAAGSEGSGFWVALPEHPTGPSATNKVWPRYTPLAAFSGNVAHSNGSDGLHVDGGPNADGEPETSYYRPSASPNAVNKYGRNSSESVQVTFKDFVAYKNRNRGVWLRGENHLLDGAILADNAIGATFASDESVVVNSLFVGETANIGTPRTWEETGEEGRSLPKPWRCDKATDCYAFPIRGFEFYDGRVAAQASHFANFSPDSVREASALSYLRFTDFFVNPLNSAKDLSFAEGTKRVYLELQEEALRGPEDPSEGSQDGYRSAVFLDADGSVSAEAGHYVVVDNPFLLSERCSYRDSWVAWVCDERYTALMLRTPTPELAFADIDRADGETHRMFGDGRSPSHVLRTLLMPSARYRLEPEGGAPETIELILYEGVGEWLELSLDYPGGLPTVTRYGRPIFAVDSPQALADLEESGYYYDGLSGTLYLRLTGSSRYEAIRLER